MKRKDLLNIKNKTFEKYDSELSKIIGEKHYKKAKIKCIDIFSDMWNEIIELLETEVKIER